MRLFVAVELSAAVRSAAAACGARLSAALGADCRQFTWVGVAKLHVTLVFIGERKPQELEPILQVLGPSLALDPFDIVVGGWGTFPSTGSPHVVWLGVRHGAAALGAVHTEVVRRLDARGIGHDERPFHGHVTLARLRRRARAGRVARVVREMPDEVAGRSLVDHVTLFDSQEGSHGTEYVPLLRVSLCSTSNCS